MTERFDDDLGTALRTIVDDPGDPTFVLERLRPRYRKARRRRALGVRAAWLVVAGVALAGSTAWPSDARDQLVTDDGEVQFVVPSTIAPSTTIPVTSSTAPAEHPSTTLEPEIPVDQAVPATPQVTEGLPRISPPPAVDPAPAPAPPASDPGAQMPPATSATTSTTWTTSSDGHEDHETRVYPVAGGSVVVEWEAHELVVELEEVIPASGWVVGSAHGDHSFVDVLLNRAGETSRLELRVIGGQLTVVSQY